MASKISALFVLVTLLALQGTESSIISDVEKFVKEAITSAVNEFEKVENRIKKGIENVIGKAVEGFEDSVGELWKRVEKAINDVDATNVAVTKCVSTGRDEMDEVRNQTRERLDECSGQARQVIDPDMEGAWKEVQKINSTGRELLHNLTACNWNAACLLTTSSKGVLHLNQMGIDLGRAIVKIEAEVPETVVTAAACSRDTVTSAVSEDQQVTNSTLTCIKEAITPHSS